MKPCPVEAGFWKPAATEGAVLGYGMVGMLGLAVLARCHVTGFSIARSPDLWDCCRGVGLEG
eukprot:639353-Amphidinium_carterae.1